MSSLSVAARSLAALCLGLSLCACGAEAPAAEDRTEIALIVYGDIVMTMDVDGTEIANGAVAIDDGAIVAVGTAREIDAAFTAADTLSGEGRVVMPGLVNGHTHAAMSLLRGIADDLELIEWLERFIFPAEVAVVDEEFVRIGTRLACWEMIRGGTTSFVDMYYFPDAMAEETLACGLRGVIVPSVIEQKSPDAETGAESLAQAVDFVRRWRDRDGRIIPAIGAHSVYTLSRPRLEEVQAAAAAEGAPVSIHVSESTFEIQVTAANHGMTPVELLDDMGFLDLPLIAAHMVYPSASDMALLAEHGVGVVHNPTSNMKLASGVSPVAAMLEAGVRVGIGTDGAASNNDLDMWEDVRLAALLSKVSTGDPTALPARQVLDMATRSGARAIGLGDLVGQLVPGKRADVIQVDLTALDAAPRFDAASHLVYVTDADDVVTTIVDGQVLMREREILGMDAEALRRDVAQWRERIIAATGGPAQTERNESP
ncbi:MAG: amidohydrolase family protein [Pseudomonadota bacterium]